jgi:hypothetical protein
LAVRSDGTLVAFGNSSSGQTTVPTLPIGTRFAAVSAGGAYSLAIQGAGLSAMNVTIAAAANGVAGDRLLRVVQSDSGRRYFRSTDDSGDPSGARRGFRHAVLVHERRTSGDFDHHRNRVRSRLRRAMGPFRSDDDVRERNVAHRHSPLRGRRQPRIACGFGLQSEARGRNVHLDGDRGLEPVPLRRFGRLHVGDSGQRLHRVVDRVRLHESIGHSVDGSPSASRSTP